MCGFRKLPQILQSLSVNYRVAFWMHARVAFSAKRDQVLFHVSARLAAQFDVMHVQVLHATADLASPAVALQYLLFDSR